jgi:26S proteasome regulatory subunit N11
VAKDNEKVVAEMKALADSFEKEVTEEGELEPAARSVARVGKMDAKKHLDAQLNLLMSANIMQCMATMLDTLVF